MAKGKEKQKQVLLAVPDGPIDAADDTDPYLTKLGGLPIWLQDSHRPDADCFKCKVCRKWMYLLCQTYVPLPDSVFHRVLYVLGCNRRQCMGKDGSFAVIRSHLADPEYVKDRQKKDAQKKKQQQKQKQQQQQKQTSNSSGFGVPQGFQMGDVWGANKSFGANTGGFGSTTSASSMPFGSSATSTSGGFGTLGFGASKVTQTEKKAQAEPAADTLAKRLGALALDQQDGAKKASPAAASKPTVPIDTALLPSFPGEYLYTMNEDVSEAKQEGDAIDISKYQEYIDMAEQFLEEGDADDDAAAKEQGGTWSNEAYEKQALPRGVDKQFKRFTERVAHEPSQCVRYEWAGTPLLFHDTNTIKPPACPLCGQPRVFEMQLMPNVLSILPAADAAASSSAPATPSTKQQQLDALNQGMDFGTILVYVCQGDCHPGDELDASHVIETAIVQYERD
ncbi:programmed cell death protein 2 [Gongronella butleri]|nr:programmed cell death protein 2 [Gongronella butleri]